MRLLLHPNSNTVCHPDLQRFIQPIHVFDHPSLAGTMGYIPPEAMVRGSGVEVSSAEYKKWDVYSFGVLMCYILSGKDPFAGMSEAQIMAMIAFNHKRPVIPPHVDKDPHNPVFKEMIQVLWHRDPERRSDFAAIVEQLSAHVVDPQLKQSMVRKFLRTLPPLLASKECMHLSAWTGLCAEFPI